MKQLGKSFKSEETILGTIRTIYIPLLDEGTDVSRPTMGENVGGNFYEVLPTPDYDPNIEVWKFLPGNIVLVDTTVTSAGHVLMAQRVKSEEDVQ